MAKQARRCIKARVLGALMEIVRWFFVDRKVTWYARVPGEKPILRDTGVVVSGVIDRGLDGTPTGMVLVWQPDHGRGPTDMRYFQITELKHTKGLGWCVYD